MIISFFSPVLIYLWVECMRTSILNYCCFLRSRELGNVTHALNAKNEAELEADFDAMHQV